MVQPVAAEELNAVFRQVFGGVSRAHGFDEVTPRKWERHGMTSSSLATETAEAKRVRITGELRVVELRDGRTVSVPISWYPRLADGRPAERRNWTPIG
jgi:hypothetical protein